MRLLPDTHILNPVNITAAFRSLVAGIVLLFFSVALLACNGDRSSNSVNGDDFWAANFTTNIPYAYKIKASKAGEGAHCYIYVEQGRSVSQDKINAIVNEFDNVIYPKNTTTFGGEPNPGVDNDQKIYILLLDIKDGYSSAKPTYIAGYFDSGHEYPQSVYSASNQKEMLFMDIYPATPGSQRFFNVLAHEFQHMIHWEQKDHLQGIQDDTWLNEGMSEIAPVYCGYGPSYSRVSVFEQYPSDSLTKWDSNIADYGVVYMWAQYFKDRFNDSEPNIFWSMLHDKQTGIDSVHAALDEISSSITFTTTFQDWAIANYSGSSTTWTDPNWSYTSIDMWNGTYNSLFPPSRENPLSPLTALDEWSVNYYSFTPGSLTWTAETGSHQKSALVDGSSSAVIYPDLISGQTYTFANKGYLIISNPSGTKYSSGDTFTRTSIEDNWSADIQGTNSSANDSKSIKTPKAMLDETNKDPRLHRLVQQTGEPESLCVRSYFEEKEKLLKAGGARPRF